MARFALFLGVLAIGGGIFVANDTAKMSVADPEYQFDIAAYANAAPERIQNYVAEDLGPKLAALPQVAQEKYDNWQNPPPESVEATERLAGLKERNTSLARNGVTMDELAKMSPMEIYQNLDLIMEGLANQAKAKMESIF